MTKHSAIYAVDVHYEALRHDLVLLVHPFTAFMAAGFVPFLVSLAVCDCRFVQAVNITDGLDGLASAVGHRCRRPHGC